ncbi:MAG: hypothetical protein J07HR59_00511 [Halorubrum sp. J07HR59]|nr:MAG: hypothetical protein J07HR59_00511 [Halorubrum sp. J07HR59]
MGLSRVESNRIEPRRWDALAGAGGVRSIVQCNLLNVDYSIVVGEFG